MLWRGVTFILNNLSLWCPASLKKARSNLYLFIGREPEPLSEACELEVLSHSLFLSASCSVSVCSSWSWKVRLVTEGRHIVSYWSTSWFSFYSRAIYQGSCWSWNNKSGQVVNVIASLSWACSRGLPFWVQTLAMRTGCQQKQFNFTKLPSKVKLERVKSWRGLAKKQEKNNNIKISFVMGTNFASDNRAGLGIVERGTNILK